MGLIFAVMNIKGGVGKTTITGNLADAVGRLGHRVLVVDMDSQCNTTSLLDPGDHPTRNTVRELLAQEEPELAVRKCISPTRLANVSILPNLPETASLEAQLLLAGPTGNSRLRRCLRNYARRHFAFTLIDTPPHMGTFVLLALYAADGVILPIKAGSAFSVEGLLKAVRLITEVKHGANPDLRFLRLLINHMDRRTIISRNIAQEIAQAFREEQLFRTTIPVNTAFERAESLGQTIFQFNPRASGAKAFQELARELVDICGLAEDAQRRTEHGQLQEKGQADPKVSGGLP
ncbi:MAG: ParA family protein [Syntrophobacterales bacterium]|jgi:chromosome partitioning protein